MTKRQKSVADQIEEQLQYRLPQSHKPLSTIILTRAQAEELLKEIYQLRLETEDVTR